MKFIIVTWFFCAVLVYQCCAQGESPVKVRVLKDNANLRAKAALNVEVVGQAAADQELAVKSMDMEWVEVAVPTNIDFWVLGDYLKNDLVVCRQKVNVRAGPGLNFSVVGQMNNGDKVEVRGSHADWIKIAPTETTSIWISRHLVEIVSPAPPVQARAQVAKPTPAEPVAVQPTGTSVQVTAKKTESAGPPEPAQMVKSAAVPGSEEISTPQASKPAVIKPPQGLDLIPDIGQGQTRQFQGTLKSKNFLVRSPADFRLVATAPGGQPQTICFVKGNRSQLKVLLFRELTIIGRQYWVHHCRYPVVVPEKIILK
jgi:hypothetical protein